VNRDEYSWRQVDREGIVIPKAGDGVQCEKNDKLRKNSNITPDGMFMEKNRSKLRKGRWAKFEKRRRRRTTPEILQTNTELVFIFKVQQQEDAQVRERCTWLGDFGAEPCTAKVGTLESLMLVDPKQRHQSDQIPRKLLRPSKTPQPAHSTQPSKCFAKDLRGDSTLRRHKPQRIETPTVEESFGFKGWG